MVRSSGCATRIRRAQVRSLGPLAELRQPGASTIRRLSTWLSCVVILAGTGGTAAAAEYYVAPAGSDASPGSLAQPFASLQKGNDVAQPGDTIWIRGGIYKLLTGASSVSGVELSKSGESDTKRIKYWAYGNEVPIFDFSQWKSSAANKSNGIYVTGSWLHLRGLEIANLPQAGTFTNSGLLTLKASNNIFELLNIHHIGGPGLFINGGEGGNLILNCDAHDNYDPDSAQGAGENGDGFGVHYQSTGPSSVIRGCRAWWNADDGYDLISQEVPVTIENSWAMANGTIKSGTARAGNGNGFKAGSSKTGIRHTIRNCVAWKNPAAGFYANHSSGGNNWYNNTAYQNGTQFNLLASPSGDTSATITLSGALAHKMRNNVGFPEKNSNMGGVDSAFNTWDLKLVPSSEDFVSVADTDCMGPRQADGSLPATGFMKLRAGSQLIDQGADVGIAFVGSAADLGADEYGAAGNSGNAGSSSGGSAHQAGSGSGSASTQAGDTGAPVSAAGSGTAGDAGGSTAALSGAAGNAGAGRGTPSSSAGQGALPPAASEASGCACAAGRRASSASLWASAPGLLGLVTGLRARRRRRRLGCSSSTCLTARPTN